MKKIVSLLLIALLALALIGCGGGKAPQSAPTAAPAKTEAPAQDAEPAKAEEAPKAETPTAAEPAPAEAPTAAEPENVSPFVGSWKLYAQEGGLDQTHEQLLAQAEKMGLGDDLARFVTVTFRDDGTYSMSVYGGLADEVWEDNGDGTGVFHVNGKTTDMNVSDGILRIFMGANWYVMEPSDRSAAELAKPKASPLVGSWLYYSQQGVNGGQTVTHEEVEQYRAQGYGAMVDMVLTINADGTCKLLWLGELSDGTWTDNGDGTGAMRMEGKTMTLSVKDGMLISAGDDNVSSFEKTDRTAG